MVSNKIKNIRIVVLIFIYFFIAVSCNEDDNSNNDKYSPIESDILFTFAPDSVNEKGTIGNIALYLKTDTIYNCINYEIVYREKIQTDQIDINLQGIVLPGEICATALGPARAKIPLGITTGEFNLKFTYDSSTDNHNVSIYDSLVVVVPIDTFFTHYVKYSSGQWW